MTELLSDSLSERLSQNAAAPERNIKFKIASNFTIPHRSSRSYLQLFVLLLSFGGGQHSMSMARTQCFSCTGNWSDAVKEEPSEAILRSVALRLESWGLVLTSKQMLCNYMRCFCADPKRIGNVPSVA